MFPRIDWKRMFVDLGWAMAMADPMCYSYYLASRKHTTRDGEREIDEPRMALPRLRLENRVPLGALSGE